MNVQLSVQTKVIPVGENYCFYTNNMMWKTQLKTCFISMSQNIFPVKSFMLLIDIIKKNKMESIMLQALYNMLIILFLNSYKCDQSFDKDMGK